MAGITTFLDPTLLPGRTMEQEPFDQAMAYVMQNFPKWGNEVNATLGLFNAGLAGGAYALPYVFDTATADADPGTGKLRLSSASQNAATAIRLDAVAGGQDVSSILDKFDASTSDVKGAIRLAKVGDPTKWLTFDVIARVPLNGYRNFVIVNTGGSSVSPFAAGDSVLLFFQRNGDVGAGKGAMQFLGSLDFLNSPVTVCAFTGIFTPDYDRYQIELNDITPTVSGGVLQMQFGGTNNAAITSNYLLTMSTEAQSSSPGSSAMNLSAVAMAAQRSSFVIEVSNMNGGAGFPRLMCVRGAYQDTPNSYYRWWHAVGAYVGAVSPIAGFRVALSTNVTFTGKAKVYGIKNT